MPLTERRETAGGVGLQSRNQLSVRHVEVGEVCWASKWRCGVDSWAYVPGGLVMLSQGLSVDREEKSSRTPGLTGQGQEDKSKED